MVLLKYKRNILPNIINMTFRDYVTKTAKGKRELRNYFKKHPEVKKKIERMKNRVILPQSKDSRHMDTSNMGVTGQLPAATQGNQPGMS
jgi:hypothetical protein